MIPVAIAPVLEHIGDVYVVGAVAKKDFVADPGIHRTMLGDGCACLASAFLGGPPETTYSEVTGAMSITKITSPAVIRISAATAICFSVVGKLSALLQSIPQAVLGGIMLLLFGTIASVGVQNLMQNKVDMNDTRNVIIISLWVSAAPCCPAVRSPSRASDCLPWWEWCSTLCSLRRRKRRRDYAMRHPPRKY